MLKDQIKQFILANHLIEPDDLVIIAVSGGPDSMLLLHILVDLKHDLECQLVVAHLNHCLRPTAWADEALVMEACAQLGIDCYTHKADIAELARQNKQSLEEAGREERYRWFRQLKQEINAQQIATAHHQDDVAETVLLHLLRGAGVKGLRGILPAHQDVVRPLLQVNKQEIMNYLVTRGIKYCLDQSNSDLHYVRNRIRHGLLPYLRSEFNPEIVKGLSQLASIAGSENETLEIETARLWPAVAVVEKPDTIILKVPVLALLHLAYQRRLAVEAFSRLTNRPGWTMDDVDKVLELSTKSGSSLTLQLKNQVQVSKVYDRLVFTTCPLPKIEFGYPVKVPGRVSVAEIDRIFEFSLIAADDMNIDIQAVYLDYGQLPVSLWIRSRQPGDIFRPHHMPGTKKLKKYLIDLKIPSTDRDRLALLAGDNGEIYSIIGMDISRLVAISGTTTSVLKITWHPVGNVCTSLAETH